MTWLVMLIALLTGTALQLLLPGYHIFGQVKFPVLLAISLYYALNREAGVAFMAAVLAGLFQDTMSMIPLGYSSACFCFITWISGRYRSVILLESTLTPVFFGAVAVPVSTLCLYFLLRTRDLVHLGPLWLVLKLSGGAFLGAVVTPPVFCFLRRFDVWVGNIDSMEAS